MKAETGIMQLQAKEYKALLANHEKLKKRHRPGALTALRRNQACCHTDLRLLA